MRADQPEREAIVDKAVEALGGQNFLTMRNRVDSGRAYSFYREQLSGLDIATIYTEYLDSKPPENGVAFENAKLTGKNRNFRFCFFPTRDFSSRRFEENGRFPMKPGIGISAAR